MAYDMHVGLIVDDKSVPVIQKVQRELDRLHRRASLWNRTMGPAVAGLIRPFQALGRQIFNLRNIFLAVGAAWTAIRMVDYATKIEAIDASFKSLSTRLGTDYLTVLQRLRGATKGTVDDLGLMMSANRAVLLGAASTVQGLEVLAVVSRRLGRAMGMDTATAFDNLVLAMGRMQPRILDNIGIVVKQSEAQATYARETGKALHQLTALDRLYAFSNEAITKSIERIKSMGEDTDMTLDTWGRLKATILNTYQDLLRGLLPTIEKAAEKLTKFIKDHKADFFDWIAKLLLAADTAIPSLIRAFESFGLKVSVILSPLKQLANILLDISEWSDKISLGKSERALIEAASASGIPKGVIFDKKTRVTAGPWGSGVGQEYVTRDDAAQRILEYAKSDTSGRVDMETYKAVDAYIRNQEAIADIQRVRGIINAEQAPLGGAGMFDTGVPPGGFTLGIGLRESAAEIQKYGRDLRDKASSGELNFDKQYPPKEDLTKTAEAATQMQRSLLGVGDALNEIYFKGTDTFLTMKSLILDVSDSLTDNLANGFTDAILGAKSFGEAMRQMAKSIAEDILKIIIKLLMMRMLAMSLGAIPGVGTALGMVGKTPAATDPFSGQVISNTGIGGLNQTAEHAKLEAEKAAAKGMARGGTFGIISTPTYFEGTGPEAAVPLPDGRRIPVELLDDARGQVVNNYYINTIDAKSFDQYFNESAGRNKNTLGKIASQQFQNDRAVRRGFQS